MCRARTCKWSHLQHTKNVKLGMGNKGLRIFLPSEASKVRNLLCRLLAEVENSPRSKSTGGPMTIPDTEKHPI